MQFHQACRAVAGPFIAINVAAMPENLLEIINAGGLVKAMTQAQRSGLRKEDAYGCDND